MKIGGYWSEREQAGTLVHHNLLIEGLGVYCKPDSWRADHPRVGLYCFASQGVRIASDCPHDWIRHSVFWESMRQQGSQRNIGRGYGLSCPYAASGKLCCGRRHLLTDLWDCLPDNYRVRMTPRFCEELPHCGPRSSLAKRTAPVAA